MLKNIPCTFVSSRILNCVGLHTIDFMDVSHVTMHRGDNFCEKEVMVLLPGFGSVAAFFVKAVPELSSQYHVVCVDWLGTGGSDRPDYTCTPGEEAEAFFVDALEKWRIAMGYYQIHICGHSIGAVLAASYAIRFPVWTQSLNHFLYLSLTHTQRHATSPSISTSSLICFALPTRFAPQCTPFDSNMEILTARDRGGAVPTRGHPHLRPQSHVLSCCLASPAMPRDFVPQVQKERTSELPTALRIINYAAWKKQITPQVCLVPLSDVGNVVNCNARGGGFEAP